MVCHPRTFRPPPRSNRSPRHPKTCFSGSNTRVLGSPLYDHTDSGISIQSDKAWHIMTENRHKLSHKCIKLLYFQYTFNFEKYKC